MGMYKKDSGSLSVLGSDEAYTNPDQALKAGVAMIHQELNPIPDMSVYENKLKECLQNGVIEESRFLPDVYVAKNYDMEKGLLNELVLQYY